MGAGEVLFQDDVEKSPAKKTPRGHWSGRLPAQINTQQFKHLQRQELKLLQVDGYPAAACLTEISVC